MLGFILNIHGIRQEKERWIYNLLSIESHVYGTSNQIIKYQSRYDFSAENRYVSNTVYRTIPDTLYQLCLI